MTTYHVHFGALSVTDYFAAEVNVPGLGYCSATSGGMAFRLIGDQQAYLEGTWTEWGPDGYDADEDSLHVIVEFDHKPTSQEMLTARRDLNAWVHPGSRLVDYAVVTTKDDWADVRGVATFTSLPEVVTFRARLGWDRVSV